MNNISMWKALFFFAVQLSFASVTYSQSVGVELRVMNGATNTLWVLAVGQGTYGFPPGVTVDKNFPVVAGSALETSYDGATWTVVVGTGVMEAFDVVDVAAGVGAAAWANVGPYAGNQWPLFDGVWMSAGIATAAGFCVFSWAGRMFGLLGYSGREES